jgi:MFS transporter, FHS family, Na+ dependent glucose transporter 1
MSSSAAAARAASPDRKVTIAQTAAYYAGFIAIGLCGGQLGPSLSTLANHTGSTLGAISVVFVASAFGRLIGSLSGGWLLDRVRGHPLMALGYLFVGSAMALIPLAQSLPALIAVLLFYGVAVNWLDVGANTLIVRVHGEKVAPYMNGLHLTFGIGGSLAPLLVGRSFALTNDIHASYWLVAALMLPMALWQLRLPSPVVSLTDSAQAAQPVAPWLIIALGVFFFCLVGIEVTGAQWTFNLGLALGMSREAGAPLLASTFWWTYSIGRLISIPLALRVPPARYLVIDLAGAVIFALVLLFALLTGGNETLVWIGVIGSGLAIASAFPSALSYVGSHMNMTGKITGSLFASANIGVMVVPWVVGQLFEPVGTVAIPVMNLLLLAIASLALVAIVRLLQSSRNATSSTSTPLSS